MAHSTCTLAPLLLVGLLAAARGTPVAPRVARSGGSVQLADLFKASPGGNVVIPKGTAALFGGQCAV